MDRCLTPELMDDPAIDAGEHQRALLGLARLNRLSRATQILWPAVREVAQRRGGTVSLLDIATGAGDLPIALAQRAAATGISLAVHACDCSAVAVDHARSRLRSRSGAVRTTNVVRTDGTGIRWSSWPKMSGRM